MNYEVLFLQSLALTVFIETAVLYILFRFFGKNKGIKLGQILTTGFITSFATLPYLWFVFPTFIQNATLYVISAETFAVLVETIIIQAILRTNLNTSFLISLLCNAISFSIGLLIKWP